MAFRLLLNSTTADASDVNDNFYHVAQGSRLPMMGDRLESEDGTYDLGSSTYRWDTLYCQDVNFNNNIEFSDQLYILISSSTVDTPTTRLEVSGINGDDYSEFIIINTIVGDIQVAPMSMFINGDSATNYGYQLVRGVSTTIFPFRQQAQGRIRMANSGVSGGIGLTKMKMTTKSGQERVFMSQDVAFGSGTEIDRYIFESQVWNNSSDTITSLVFNSLSTSITSYTVQIYGR